MRLNIVVRPVTVASDETYAMNHCRDWPLFIIIAFVLLIFLFIPQLYI